MPWFSQNISTDTLTGKARLFEVDEHSNNKNSIYARGLVYFLDSNGDKITDERLKPYMVTIEAERGKAPYVNPANGDYAEAIFDEDGEVTNGVIPRYDFLKYLYFNVEVNNGEMLALFIQRADLDGEFDK